MWVASSKNISKYAIFNEQNFNDTLTNDIISFEQLGPEWYLIKGNEYLRAAMSENVSQHYENTPIQI